MTQEPTIIGFDPGTKYMGVVVLRGKELLSYGVHTLRNGERPYDVIGQAKRVVLRSIGRWEPPVVVYEEPLPIANGQAAIMRVVAEALDARGRELGVTVQSLSPSHVRQALLGNTRAKKLEVAHELVRMGYTDLGRSSPSDREDPHWGLHRGRSTGFMASMRWRSPLFRTLKRTPSRIAIESCPKLNP